ncbi:AEC family transporter [Roseateles amylovorans]|uniref:AEC family transporter n=1 Tax=Roseateles amylovorans TaxID=2978473 RepID=A0ABY6AWW1_9BURK|nr:AEC family transporter [Roseateles amylovorans]UXH76798.1 AEC family transporter [Roseateles amylovorans]
MLLLLPDFLLIVAGFLLCRYTALDRPLWEAAEKLVYFLLFPVLLFNSISRSTLQPADTVLLLVGGLAVMIGGIALAYALGLAPGVDARAHASGVQVAFRFNSFVALALAERLQGPQGVAWIAMIAAICVPVANVAAVWPLARHGGHGYLKELARNPLIIATLGGLAANLSGLRLPEPAAITLQRIGLAALPLGLMAVGAGLRLGALKDAPRLAVALLSIRHLILPLWALLLARLLALPLPQAQILLAFAAMPTASSAYVLAVRMGGNGPFVAGLVTVSTLLGMVVLPLWLQATPLN